MSAKAKSMATKGQRKKNTSKKNQKQNQPVSGRRLRSNGERVEVPLAYTRLMKTGVPSVSGSPYAGDGRVRVRHREYIQDVSGSVAFSASSFSINPGISTVFPWLSKMARLFESYLFRSLKFEYETQKSASTSGSLMLAVDFDAADSAPVNKQQIMAFHNAVRAAVWEECCYKSSAGDLAKFGVQRYIRSGNLAANQDIKTFDVGNLIVASQGEADTTAIGELYVEYDVELITPQIDPNSEVAQSVNITMTAASRAAPFTGTQVITGGLSVSASGSTLTFNQPGQYLMEQEDTGTVCTNTLPTIGGTATVVALQGRDLNAASTKGIEIYTVNVTDKGQTVTFDFTASCTTLTGCVVRIAPYAVANA